MKTGNSIWVVEHEHAYEGSGDVSYHATEEGAEKQRLKLIRKDVRDYARTMRPFINDGDPNWNWSPKRFKAEVAEYKRGSERDIVKNQVKLLE